MLGRLKLVVIYSSGESERVLYIKLRSRYNLFAFTFHVNVVAFSKETIIKAWVFNS